MRISAVAKSAMGFTNLLTGKEADVFPKLEAEGRKAIEEDSADVICLGRPGCTSRMDT